MGITNFFKNLLSDKSEDEIAFKIGESVKVKKGTKDPDLPHLVIGGWQGRVVSFESPEAPEEDVTVGIQWDSQTLRQMPSEAIRHAIEEGMDYTCMYLGMNSLEKTESRDTLHEVEMAIQEINQQYKWVGMGEDGERIKEILAGVDPDDIWACMGRWEIYLAQKMTFPLEVVPTSGHFQQNLTEQVSLVGLEETDDLRGLIGTLKIGKRTLLFPLADLAGATPSDSTTALRYYAVWFANL